MGLGVEVYSTPLEKQDGFVEKCILTNFPTKKRSDHGLMEKQNY